MSDVQVSESVWSAITHAVSLSGVYDAAAGSIRLEMPNAAMECRCLLMSTPYD